MPSTSPPATMKPDDRFRELAAIFAQGVLRLRKAVISSTESTSPKVSESRADGLDAGGDSRLTGPTG